ncbi:MAG: response regulator [Polyangiales bacterium]
MTHRVLLVDDEPALLGALRRVVERACPDAVVVYASDAKTAVWQLETTAIRLVVTDLTMNGDVGAGMEVVRAAKAAGVPVAIITGTEDAALLAEIVGAAVPVMLKRTMSSEKLAALVSQTFAT